MSDLDDYKRRVGVAQQAWASMPLVGLGVPGPPDPETGERWDRGHVMAHVAEMIPFWTGQVRAVVAGATSIGRGEDGSARREQGIRAGHDEPEAELHRRIDDGLSGLSSLLGELEESDLDRRATFRTGEGDREVDVRFALNQVLIGHLEGHLHQLQEIEAHS